MSIQVKVYSREVKSAMSKSAEAALRGVGEHLQSALADNTHKQTGLLANSYNYRTPEYESDFGNGVITGARQSLSEEEKVSQPPALTVRTGSALSYAEPYNNRFKVFEQTIDSEQGNIGGIVAATFKKEIGT